MKGINRRSFLKGTALGAGSLVLGSSYIVNANEATKEAGTRTFSLNLQNNMKFGYTENAKVWIPLAYTNATQRPRNLKVEGNYDGYTLSNNHLVPLLEASWTGKKEDSLHLVKVGLNLDIDLAKNLNLPEGDYLHCSRDVRVDRNVKLIADAVTKLALTDEQKARNLFGWVIANVDSKNAKDKRGIRTIYAKDGSELLKGNNISASSVFVALCRACGIEASEAFGLTLDSGRFNLADASRRVYTRSAIKLNNKWVPNDIQLAINGSKTLEQHKVANFAFNTWDNNWALLNFSRDYEIHNSYETKLLSTLQVAYGVVDGATMSHFDKDHTNYNIQA
ncbi:hypothetical protein BKH43_00295 [Helicobacter sp. 13S00401-1]|uniref:transglutaminase domain-containing protein n=1 Tax=Helicobacter sp. 13S00401-1 TaxID=1905758 RepID=UPI000BA6347E|nr:transglutaminase domain-containing protein [Helicobacter sp. 13S00401-1]PAF51717.1 hypothetical protein BKH43_00295 [Helicobacter sp. 13S00401-1]